jgi:hypothetical protein
MVTISSLSFYFGQVIEEVADMISFAAKTMGSKWIIA